MRDGDVVEFRHNVKHLAALDLTRIGWVIAGQALGPPVGGGSGLGVRGRRMVGPLGHVFGMIKHSEPI